MAGKSQRPGAKRKPTKGPQVGTGGYGRKALEGRGPTPKAEDRSYHPAYKPKRDAEARPAQKRPTLRAERGHEVIGGRNSVLEALREGVPVRTIYVAFKVEADDRTREIVRIASNRQIPLLEVSKVDIDGLTHGLHHQGVAAEVPEYAYAHPADLLVDVENPLILALDGITDPHNLGAALRSAAAFGADGVLLPERRAAGVNATAWKVSAGAAARVPVARATNLVRALTDYKDQGLFVVGLDAGGDHTIADFPLADGPLVLVLGSEGKGLSRLVRETCDMIVSIPISGEMESLNAAVALGITLYEVSRSRGKV